MTKSLSTIAALFTVAVDLTFNAKAP